MSQPNVPIVNAPNKYVDGLKTSIVDGVIIVSAGSARDSSNVDDIVLSAPVAINPRFVGPNGMEDAIVALNTMYAVYVIGDSKGYQPGAALLKVAGGSVPALPQGYDMYRRVGWAISDSVAAPSTGFIKWFQFGDGLERQYYYDAVINIATAVTSTSYAALAAKVPPLSTQAFVRVAYTAAAVSQKAHFFPIQSPAALANAPGMVQFGCGAAAASVQSGNIVVPVVYNSDPSVLASQFQYKVDAGSVTLDAVGFVDNLAS